jgi:hypothetical protein
MYDIRVWFLCLSKQDINRALVEKKGVLAAKLCNHFHTNASPDALFCS